MIYGGHDFFYDGPEDDDSLNPGQEGYVWPMEGVLKEGMPRGWSREWDRWLGERCREGWMSGEVWRVLKRMRVDGDGKMVRGWKVDVDGDGEWIKLEGLTREWFDRRMILAGFLGLGMDGRGWEEEGKEKVDG